MEVKKLLLLRENITGSERTGGGMGKRGRKKNLRREKRQERKNVTDLRWRSNTEGFRLPEEGDLKSKWKKRAVGRALRKEKKQEKVFVSRAEKFVPERYEGQATCKEEQKLRGATKKLP